jgi:hypothetical protein
VKIAAITPATTQKPLELPLNGMPPTFMPQTLAISVAGKNITENIVSVKVSVGLLVDLRPQLFDLELTAPRVILRILAQCRVAMDLAVEWVEFFGRKQRRTLAREFEHRRALVGHVAGDPD